MCCDICEQRRFPLLQIIVKLVSGRWRWYSVCQDCMQSFERESED